MSSILFPLSRPFHIFIRNPFLMDAKHTFCTTFESTLYSTICYLVGCLSPPFLSSVWIKAPQKRNGKKLKWARSSIRTSINHSKTNFVISRFGNREREREPVCHFFGSTAPSQFTNPSFHGNEVFSHYFMHLCATKTNIIPIRCVKISYRCPSAVIQLNLIRI